MVSLAFQNATATYWLRPLTCDLSVTNMSIAYSSQTNTNKNIIRNHIDIISVRIFSFGQMNMKLNEMGEWKKKIIRLITPSHKNIGYELFWLICGRNKLKQRADNRQSY